MSDGPNDAKRAARELDRLDAAANELADALEDIKNQAFGYSQQTLDVINHALKKVHLKVQPLVQIQIQVCNYWFDGHVCKDLVVLGHTRCREHLTRR